MNAVEPGIEGRAALRRRNLWRWWGLSLIIGGVALLLLAGAYYGYIRFTEARYASLISTVPPPPQSGIAVPIEQPTQEPHPSATTSPTTEPTGTADTPGTPLPLLPPVRIVIPAIGLDAKVVDLGSYNEVAKFAVGHYPSAVPGQAGNIVMAGHLRSDLLGEGDVFKRLPDIGKYVGITAYQEQVVRNPPSEPRPVYISIYDSNGREYSYQAVETLVVLPSSGWILDPTPDEILTLITCIPEWAYSHRFVVRARPVP